jgi:hypothetical protein
MIKFLLILLLISPLSAEEMIIGKEIIKSEIDRTFLTVNLPHIIYIYI